MAQHSHALPGTNNERALWIALALTGTFMIAEVVGGLLTHSLALLSDAAHMLTDVMALVIALLAQRIGRWPLDSRRTFGYRRFEVLAAAFNALLLFGVAAYILFEAYQRFRSPAPLNSSAMLIIAVLGLAVNLASMRVLASGKDHNINMKGAYLEVWSDLLGSAGVIGGALIIRYTGWLWVDPLIAVAIGFWVLPRTWLLLRESLNLLLEGVPEGVDVAAIEKTMRSVAGVRNVHDLHVWAITTNQMSLTAHLVIDVPADAIKIVRAVSERISAEHHIGHATLQCEGEECSNSEHTGAKF